MIAGKVSSDLGKDQRDHACHVDHQRQGALDRHRHAVAHAPPGVHHRDVAAALLDEDDGKDGQDE